jgi:hypothetical protein
VLGVDHKTIQRDLAPDAPESGALRATRGDETLAGRAAIAEGAAAAGITALPTGKYRVVYADPPEPGLERL